jgi:hypothetical protein
VSANAKEYLHGARAEISGRVIPETAELASVQQRCSAVLLDAANGTHNAVGATNWSIICFSAP